MLIDLQNNKNETQTIEGELRLLFTLLKIIKKLIKSNIKKQKNKNFLELGKEYFLKYAAVQ